MGIQGETIDIYKSAFHFFDDFMGDPDAWDASNVRTSAGHDPEDEEAGDFPPNDRHMITGYGLRTGINGTRWAVEESGSGKILGAQDEPCGAIRLVHDNSDPALAETDGWQGVRLSWMTSRYKPCLGLMVVGLSWLKAMMVPPTMTTQAPGPPS